MADSLLVLNEIQRTWSYLEPLFIKSEEVRKELPKDAKRFQGIDKTVRQILKDAEDTKNIVNACNKVRLI